MDPSIVVPEPSAPSGGWPVTILLHGYGSSHDSLVGVANELSRMRFAAISVPGPISLGGGGFQWPTDSALRTHNYLQSVLNTVAREQPVDRSRVLLFGFSQGGLHAVMLLATRPRDYSGALAFSPGGWLAVPDRMPHPEHPRPLVLSYGTDELPGTLDTVEACQRLWASVGFPLKVVEHSAGHEVPEDWVACFEELLARC